MKLRAIVLMLVSGLFGYSGYWFYVSGNSDIYLEKTQADLAQQGVTFEYSSYQVTGFPYRFVLDFENPVFRFQNGPLQFEFSAPQMEAIVQPWNLSHLVIFPNEALIKIRSSLNNTNEIIIKPAKLGLSINSLGDGAYRLSSELTDISLVTLPDLHLPTKFENVSFHLRKQPMVVVENEDLLEPKLLEIAIDGITKTQNTFQLNFSFQGKEIPEATISGLTLWRDQGGTLEIEQAQFSNESVALKFSGSLTLDDKLRPLGALSLTLEKSALTYYLMLNTRLANEDKKAVEDFIKTIPVTDGSISLPLTLQDGSVYLGPVRLKEIAPVIQEQPQ